MTDADLLGRIATAAAERDPDERIRALLALLREVTGLDAAYLSQIDWDGQVQHFTHSDNSDAPGAVHVPEGFSLPWADTLCRRALDEGLHWNDDVRRTWADADTAIEAGIQTYASAPVRLEGYEQLYGTLCLASSERRPSDPVAIGLLHLVAAMMAQALTSQQLIQRTRERASRAERSLRERTTFTAQVEHAMRTPLTLVHGWAEMLQVRAEEMDPEEREQAATTILKHTTRLLTQIEGLMDESKASMAVSVLTPERVWLTSIARELAGLLAPRELVITADAPVTTDQAAARVLLEHLLENAAAHTPPDTTVTVGVTATGDGVQLVVEDDGPGLPDDVDLFAAFQQGDGSEDGTGLGLHIVQTITHALGGTVAAGNRDTGGARFTIDLPHRRG